MSEDKSLDIIGAGKIAEAIPDAAWTTVVDTACDTFRRTILPLTAITSGVGRLIEAKFNRLVDAEKVVISNTMFRATEKATRNNQKQKEAHKTAIILKVIESASSEVDATLQELWTNLVANELVDGSIHPEFVRILSRLSTADAQRLIEIAQSSKQRSSLKLA